MKSTKSSSGSKQQISLSRTERLAKKQGYNFQDLGEEHLKYLWAAYRKGAFPIVKPETDAAEFAGHIIEYMDTNNVSGIVFSKNQQVMGLGLYWIRNRILQSSDLFWFPWAGAVSRVKAYTNFLNTIREMRHPNGHKYLVIQIAPKEDEAFFGHLCKYGILRRIGTSYEIFPERKTLVYETRT